MKLSGSEGRGKLRKGLDSCLLPRPSMSTAHNQRPRDQITHQSNGAPIISDFRGATYGRSSLWTAYARLNSSMPDAKAGEKVRWALATPA